MGNLSSCMLTRHLVDPDTPLPSNIIGQDKILRSTCHDVWSPDVPEGSIYQYLMKDINQHLESEPEWVVLNDLLRKEKTKMKDLLSLSRRLSILFHRNGLAPGDIIHIMLGNQNIHYALCLAAWRLGAVVSLGDPYLETMGIARQLTDTKARMVFCNEHNSSRLKEALDSLDSSRADQKIYGMGVDEDWCQDLMESIRDIGDLESDCPRPHTAGDIKKELAVILWSSGTTGLPKGILHSNFSSLNQLGQPIECFSVGGDIVTTAVFFHIGGFFLGLSCIRRRKTYNHLWGPSFTLGHLVDAMRTCRPSFIMLGSHHFVQLSESGLLDDIKMEDVASLEVIVPMGAAVPPRCREFYRSKFKNLKAALNVYGQSECGAVCIGIAAGHLGALFAGMSAKVENMETGEPCGPNEEGEICIRSANPMLEYFNRPEETAEYFDSDGFGHTGDIGYYTEKGEIIFVDRLKELIKYQNIHIAPTELEAILQKHPAVKESLVYGKPDPNVQEIVSAVVVLNKGHSVTEEELVTFVNSLVKSPKHIRGGIIFRTSLPRNTVGKLVRREMRKWAIEQQKMGN